MTIKYKQQWHDDERTMEQQLFLMTRNAKGLANTVSVMLDMLDAIQEPSREEEEIRDDLRRQMQATNNRILETDIFMAGVHHESK